MDSLIIDLRLQIQQLEIENKALKEKMTLLYANWNYDYTRYTELKEKMKLINT